VMRALSWKVVTGGPEERRFSGLWTTAVTVP